MLLSQNFAIHAVDSSQNNSVKESIVNNGFVFMDGKYISPPYRIKQAGVNLFINDVKFRNITRHPGGKVLSLDVQADLNEQKELINWVKPIREVYAHFLQQDYCYFFFSDGRQLRISPQEAAYSLPQIIETVKSGKPYEKKMASLTKRNWHLAISDADIKTLVEDLNVPDSVLTRLKNKERELLQESEFGKEDGNSVNSGFVFIDGKYVNEPYQVSRIGLGIFINGNMVEKPRQWKPDAPSGDTDIELPAGINKYTSIYDPAFLDFWQKKSAYLRNNHSRDEEQKIMENIFRRLPFVAKAENDVNNAGILKITTTEGEIIPIKLVSFARQPITSDKDALLKNASGTQKHFETLLKRRNGLLFFREGGYICLPKEAAVAQIPKIVSTLKSNLSVAEKNEALHNLNIGLDDQQIETIIDNFEANEQLSQRIQE
jgi:hypothetical protein